MMFRVVLAALLLLHNVSSFRVSREASLFDDTENDEQITMDFDEESTDLSFLGSAIKNQFKGVIEDIVASAMNHFRDMLQHFKVNLLKRLGKWTLSDIFHAIFDGVTDFVTETSSITIDERDVAIKEEKNTLKPAHSYIQSSYKRYPGAEYYFRRN